MKKEKKKIITVPDGWADINIYTFQELKNVKKKKIYETISILTDEDPEEVKTWDMASYSRVHGAMSWLNSLPTIEDFKKVIEIDGEKYGFINRLSILNLGNWVDIEHYLINPVKNLHKLMSIFYRPIIIDDIIEPYDSVSAINRSELFREKMNIQECYGALLFFSNIEKESLKSIQGYLLKEILKARRMSSKVKLRNWLGWKKTKN